MPATTQKMKKSTPADEPEVRMIRTDNIVSQSAIAKRFNTSDQAVWNWTHRDDFPPPLPNTDAGRPLWDWEEVQEWEKNWVRSKGGFHTHRNRTSVNGSRSRSRRQWMEGDAQ